MRAWGYCYIENLTWVYLRPNNHILELPSRYTNSSHITLYMFRREGAWWDGAEGKAVGKLPALVVTACDLSACPSLTSVGCAACGKCRGGQRH